MSSSSLTDSQRFNAYYAEWLRARAGLTDPASLPETDGEMTAMLDEETRLVDLLIATPAPNPAAIYRKLEVLRLSLVDDAGDPGAYADQRTMRMLVSISQDVSALAQLRAFTG